MMVVHKVNTNRYFCPHEAWTVCGKYVREGDVALRWPQTTGKSCRRLKPKKSKRKARKK